MRSSIKITLTIGMAAVISHSVARDSVAHTGHASPAAPSMGHGAEPHHATEAPPPNPGGFGDGPLFVDSRFDTVGRCRWRATSSDTATGGTQALCEEGEFPFSSGVFIGEYEQSDHRGIVNLSPAWWQNNGVQNDGLLDGEGLSDSHPQVHGEPPPDGVATENFDPDVSGSGVHFENGTGAPQRDNEIRTLCCDDLPAKFGIGALTDCHYESAMVLVDPESDPALAGQYVASLACTEGRVTSGGCHAQFLHDTGEWALTGSHPYVGGDPMQMPSGAHDSTPTETGWACRLDQEPSMYSDPDAYDEGIGVTVLCCQ